MKSDLLNFCLQRVVSGLKIENGGDDKEEAEESDLEITTNEEIETVVNSDDEFDVCEGFVDSDMLIATSFLS